MPSGRSPGSRLRASHRARSVRPPPRGSGFLDGGALTTGGWPRLYFAVRCLNRQRSGRDRQRSGRARQRSGRAPSAIWSRSSASHSRSSAVSSRSLAIWSRSSAIWSRSSAIWSRSSAIWSRVSAALSRFSAAHRASLHPLRAPRHPRHAPRHRLRGPLQPIRASLQHLAAMSGLVGLLVAQVVAHSTTLSSTIAIGDGGFDSSALRRMNPTHPGVTLPAPRRATPGPPMLGRGPFLGGRW